MPSALVSSKGRIVLPAKLRRRLGINAGARLEIIEEPDGLRLRVQQPMPTVDPRPFAGMVTAPSRGKPRSLADLDSAP